MPWFMKNLTPAIAEGNRGRTEIKFEVVWDGPTPPKTKKVFLKLKLKDVTTNKADGLVFDDGSHRSTEIVLKPQRGSPTKKIAGSFSVYVDGDRTVEDYEVFKVELVEARWVQRAAGTSYDLTTTPVGLSTYGIIANDDGPAKGKPVDLSLAAQKIIDLEAAGKIDVATRAAVIAELQDLGPVKLGGSGTTKPAGATPGGTSSPGGASPGDTIKDASTGSDPAATDEGDKPEEDNGDGAKAEKPGEKADESESAPGHSDDEAPGAGEDSGAESGEAPVDSGSASVERFEYDDAGIRIDDRAVTDTAERKDPAPAVPSTKDAAGAAAALGQLQGDDFQFGTSAPEREEQTDDVVHYQYDELGRRVVAEQTEATRVETESPDAAGEPPIEVSTVGLAAELDGLFAWA